MNEKTVDKYHFLTTDKIGQGAFGQVYKGLDTQLNKAVAIKMIPKYLIQQDKYMMEGLKREISVMQKLKGNNVVRLLDMLESTNNYYIIQEYCKDGDLEYYLQRQQYLTEVGAVRILTDILNGFIELLQQGIIHRDLKPANILVHQNVFKLGDFGFAKCMMNFQRDLMESKVGTPLYMAPQILLQQQYTSKSDIWSIGCIFYQCLFRRTPWIAQSIPELIYNIQKYPIQFPSYISSDAKDFIQKCLQLNEEDRIDWNNLYRHPLIADKFKNYVESVKNLEDKAQYIINELRQHIQRNKIDLLETFKRLKIVNNQYLQFKELQQLLNEINPQLSRQEIEFVFNMIDVDKNNYIDFMEFQKCLQQHRVRISMDFRNEDPTNVVYQESPTENKEAKLKKIILEIKRLIEKEDMSYVTLFKQFDKNQNKVLDLIEFSQFLKYFKKDICNEEITLIFQQFDRNANGGIEFQEFRSTLQDVS